MPSTRPLPTVTQLRTAGAKAVRGTLDAYADSARTGSMLDHIGGPYAVLMAREAIADRDKFRAIYIDDAEGDDLTRVIEGRLGVARVLDTFGQGQCTFARSSAAAGNGTMWRGTRVQVSGGTARAYEVAEDTAVSGPAAIVPIQATTPGPGVATSVTGGLTLLDPVYDPLWTPQTLSCADGTVFEAAADYRGRAKQARLVLRNGYLDAMVQACVDAGATYVVGFTSTYGLAAGDFDDDIGLNAVYVADANYASSPALVAACAAALEGVRVLGADLWVGQIVKTPIRLAASVGLVDDPGKLPLVPIQQICTTAALAYFAGTTGGYAYKRSAIAGAMQAQTSAIQSVSVTVPSADSNLPNLTSSAANPVPGGLVQGWPATLLRYTLAAKDVSFTFTGPS